MINTDKNLYIAIEAAIKAGRKTLEYYGKIRSIDYKSDNSPLTAADIQSNRIIESGLLPTNIPVLSEESQNEIYAIRKNWDVLWIVDPLDGTKEFIKESDEYTINIALVINKKPVIGVIYIPAKDLLYFGKKGTGAYKVKNASTHRTKVLLDTDICRKLIVNPPDEKLIVVSSKSHGNTETEEFIYKLKNKVSGLSMQNYGSSLKFCMIADGKAHIYPRLGPTMEWDTAAGHAIASSAGCKIAQLPDFYSMEYNKEVLQNPNFIVYHPSMEYIFGL